MNTNFGTTVRRAVGEAWQMRCADLRLREGTKGRQRELEAYLQGALAALTAANIMSLSQAQYVAIMVAAGRGEELIERWATLRYE